MVEERHYRGGLTISRKLTERLLVALQEGEFSDSVRLPSEVDLAAHFGVSRSVIRDVLSNLESEGFVERERGVGTTVIREIVQLQNRFDIKYEYNVLVRATGANPSVAVKSLREETADAQLAERLKIEAGDAVIICEKCVCADKVPVIYSIDKLPKKLMARRDYTKLRWERSIFDLLEEECRIVVDTDIASLKPVIGPDEIRRELEVGDGHAVLRVDEVGYRRMGRPVLYTCGYYSDYFAFTLLRKRI